MKKIACFIIIYIVFPHGINAQTFNTVSARIIDSYTHKNLQDVNIIVLKTSIQTKSSPKGTFQIVNFPKGEFIIELVLNDYEIQSIPINITGKHENIDLGIIRLARNVLEDVDRSYISLNEEDLLEGEKGESNSISGLLVSSKDVFLKTVAYEFSPTFFKPRNLGSSYSRVLLNGVVMNKIYNGRPQWSNWGGLNDVLRNQEFTLNTGPSAHTFSGIAGSTNISTRASSYRQGVKISYAMSNRSYKGRVMASYNSGSLQNGWAFSLSASRRFANEGFREGTLYAANSFFVSVEKQLNRKHSINFLAIYASNIRGKSSPNTEEVFSLKGIKYNAYWGDQEGVIRNSRLRNTEEPIFQLNHFWMINNKTSLQTNITYQFGKSGNSRLDYGGTSIVEDGDGNQSIIGGGTNPDPSYYQKLPSYFLRDIANPDYANAYLSQQEFLENGQIKWKDLYEANQNISSLGGNSIYALYEDRNDDKQLTINTILNKRIDKNFTVNAAVNYRNLRSDNFANMLDLLGGKGYLDVDVYADHMEEAQSDLQNPNRIVTKDQKYKYHFIFDASILDGFAQTQYRSKKTDAFLAVNYSNTNYQRTGLFENGAYPGAESLGKGQEVKFTNYSVKSGISYKFTGRHIISANAAYLTQAPSLQNTFSNSRENNDIVIGLKNEKISSFDISYILRHPKIRAKIGGYWIALKDQTHISFYFADGLTGLKPTETTAFVQEVMTGIDQRNFGLEIGIEVALISNIKLKGVAAIGQSTYSNDPILYLTSDDFTEPLDYGKVYLKNYFVSGGPQQAFSFGFEYSSPKYWWFGLSGNYFKNAYLNVAPIMRTENFLRDVDGLPFDDYDADIARELLEQEKFDPYYLVNMVGGKSWKINNYYIGFFANVSNIINTSYKTGGFEQSRNANYRTLLEDKSRDKPLFGPKYWFGYGTSYYTSVYFRF